MPDDGPKYLGVRLAGEPGETPVYGWLEFDVDLLTGRIRIVDKGFAPGSVTVGD